MDGGGDEVSVISLFLFAVMNHLSIPFLFFSRALFVSADHYCFHPFFFTYFFSLDV